MIYFRRYFAIHKLPKVNLVLHYKSIAEKLMGERRKILHILVHHAQLDTYLRTLLSNLS